MDRLKEILKGEVASYLELLELLRKEKVLLLSRAGSRSGSPVDSRTRSYTIDKLHEISSAIDAVVSEAQRIEASKDALMRELKATSLSALMDSLAEPDRSELLDLNSQITVLADSIKDIGTENRLIISRTLTSIRNAVNFLGGLAQADTYHANGRLDTAGGL